ncbi:MAG: PQQ-dependent sugar dehydrogenase [Maribacter sp.]
MKPIIGLLLLVFFPFFSCNTEDAQVAVDGVEEEETEEPVIAKVEISLSTAFPELSFEQPLDLQSPNDGTNRIFVVEKPGRIQVFSNATDTSEATLFLDLGNDISTTSEQGLLGLAFHPDYSSNGFFYVYYTPNTGRSVVSRFSVSASNGSTAERDSELVLLEIPQPFTNHNGGQIAFGSEGFLYIALGDGGSGGDPLNHGQTTRSLLGSILRIDVDNREGEANYAIPQDNPFVDDQGSRNEIYAYGLRNPWRMSFDSQTDKLWTGDVGQGAIEEIDIITNGGNYGWKFFEGTECFSGDCDATGLIPPIFEYDHTNGDRSITGGYVYRGAALPTLQGKYIYGDFVSGRIWALEEDGSANTLLVESGLAVASFGTDANDELYVCAFDGSIYKFVENTQ